MPLFLSGRAYDNPHIRTLPPVNDTPKKNNSEISIFNLTCSRNSLIVYYN